MFAGILRQPIFHLIHLIAFFREVPDVSMVDILLRSDQFEDVLVEAFLGGRFVVWTQRKFEIAVMVCREFHSDVDGAAG